MHHFENNLGWQNPVYKKTERLKNYKLLLSIIIMEQKDKNDNAKMIPKEHIKPLFQRLD